MKSHSRREGGERGETGRRRAAVDGGDTAGRGATAARRATAEASEQTRRVRIDAAEDEEERRGKDHSRRGGHSRTKGIARTTAEAPEESRTIMTRVTTRSMMKWVASN